MVFNNQLNENNLNLNTKLANMLKLNPNKPVASAVANSTGIKITSSPHLGVPTCLNSSGSTKQLSSDDKKINLSALKNQDPFATNIIDTALRVAVYKFVSKKNEWKKLDVEGSLFIFERIVEPLHSFVVMNTLALNLFLQPITAELEFQDRNPFLLYKSNNDIFGIWFIDKEDCERIKNLIINLTENATERKNQREKSKQTQIPTSSSLFTVSSAASEPSSLITPISFLSASSSFTNQLFPLANNATTAANVNSLSSNVTSIENSSSGETKTGLDIMQMLNKAQQQYNQSKTPSLEPTSHSTPGGLLNDEPKPITQWFLNSNKLVKPEPQRKEQQQPTASPSSSGSSSSNTSSSNQQETKPNPILNLLRSNSTTNSNTGNYIKIVNFIIRIDANEKSSNQKKKIVRVSFYYLK